MTDWTAGYVADVNYTASFFADQVPQHLALICLMNGFHPPTLSGPFTYLELGCGLGVTASVIAATCPEATVYGIDFNPSHIAGAQELAADAELDNVHFAERSFEEVLAESTVPACDFITMHGVYTWITLEDRGRIVEILRRHLKPGGVAYVSYNALPAWSGGQVLQRLICDVGRSAPERSDRQFEHGFTFATKLRDAGAPYLHDSKLFDSIVNAHQDGMLAYLTHEYMNSNWHPMFHADVVRELAGAKLQFVGSSNPIANFLDLNLTAEHQALLAGITDPALKETVKDHFAPRLLRKDVFVRGARRLTVPDQEALIKDMRLALSLQRDAATVTLNVPIGEIQVERKVFDPVFDALADGARSMADLLEVANTPDKNGSKAIEIAGLIVGSNQGAPAKALATVPPADAALRLNRALASRAVAQPIGRTFALAAAELGSAVPATGLEIRTYLGLLDGLGEDLDALARLVYAPLEAAGERLIKDGKVLETEAEALDTLRADVARIIERRCPVWRQLGAI